VEKAYTERRVYLKNPDELLGGEKTPIPRERTSMYTGTTDFGDPVPDQSAELVPGTKRSLGKSKGVGLKGMEGWVKKKCVRATCGE